MLYKTQLKSPERKLKKSSKFKHNIFADHFVFNETINTVKLKGSDTHIFQFVVAILKNKFSIIHGHF